MNFKPVFSFAAILVATAAFGQPHFSRAEQLQAYQWRADSLIRHYAHATPAHHLTRGAYMEIAARLHRHENLPWVLARLNALMQEPSGDMFWMYRFITVTYAGQRHLPPEYRQRMRELWRTYHPYRGDTENHWVMYYTALYLITQMYPGEPGERWFNRRSSQENFQEARAYLLHWMDLTTTIGQGEYDSPEYLGVFLAPMAQLYAWAEDPAIKQRAAMMLDWIIADFAVENLNGIYAGAHSRTNSRQVKEQWRANSSALAWLLWGNTHFFASSEALTLAMSGYQPAEIIHHLGVDRATPYVHKERKRTRARIRFSEVENAPVYKYIYMRKEYALGSCPGGLLQPIQQHTWDLTWAVADPRGKHNTLFTIHPYSSRFELGMYFAEQLGPITELVVRAKPEYDSGDKWTGGSPYEQVFQHEDALITLFDIPPGTRFSQISAFFSKDLTHREQDASGWIFARGGEALMAYYPLAKYEWQKDEAEDWRLLSKNLKNGAVVQIAPAIEYKSFAAFKAAVKALPLAAATKPRPHVRFTTLRGALMEFVFDETPKVNHLPVDYSDWKLFDGPYMYSEINSCKLELRHGKLRRLLDFNTLTVTDWIAE